ncbi:MAG: hypothetical protein DSY58_07750 [Desulfobulbus sp.]|nr:MAG: hypothetical protein DSY58_07750 [Desulfobulbus sp.]
MHVHLKSYVSVIFSLKATSGFLKAAQKRAIFQGALNNFPPMSIFYHITYHILNICKIAIKKLSRANRGESL